MKTHVPKDGEVRRAWWIVDAEGVTLGRLSTVVATRLCGKHKPIYTPFLDTGDHVIVVNAARVKLTGRKLQDKMYRQHSGYPGGLKEIAAGHLLAKHPERIVESAVKGMLPKGPLGRRMVRKLKVYAGADHPHRAQNPEALRVPAASRALIPGSRGGRGDLSETANSYYGTGRRKTSSARVYLRPGPGNIVVNDKPFDTYFPNEMTKMVIRQPLVVTETADKFDVFVRVRGGGYSGQAGALRHGIARALVEFNPELRAKLKRGGFLTRDPRKVERKKYGRPGARKRFQFSKR